MATATTLSDVLTFLNSRERTQEDFKAIADACRRQQAALLRARAAGVRGGEAVELEGLSPKYLNGLTGTVAEGSVTGSRCSVVLDQRSTQLLSQLSRGRYFIPDGATSYTLFGVPLACVVPAPVQASV